jgi:hypothetical protein
MGWNSSCALLRNGNVTQLSEFNAKIGIAASVTRLVYKTIAATSTAPSATQQIALPRSPANQYPPAALKQRTALDHPLAHAAGLLSIFRNFIGLSYRRTRRPASGLPKGI